MDGLFRFEHIVDDDPQVRAWRAARTGPLGALALHWLDVAMRAAPDVRVLMHDGHPTCCVVDCAFLSVGAHQAHVSVGFFRGAELPDPEGLLEGKGRFMRHVKVRPPRDENTKSGVNDAALVHLIALAVSDMRRRRAALLT